MNGAHLHLVLNHIPVVLTPVGCVVLALGLLRRRAETVNVGLSLLLAAAVIVVPAFLSGDAAAEIAGALPGVSAAAIEHHDDVASQALAVTGLAGIVALVALVLSARGRAVPKWLVAAALLLSLAACVWLGVTANLGGQIRHTEILASVPH